MGVTLEEFFDRLPAHLRRLSHQEGGKVRGRLGSPHSLVEAGEYGPLKSLLSVLLREGQIVSEDIDQLYDDHFIETCEPWAIPYIGALVGARPLEDFGQPQSARQWVAATIALRQAKGTLTALEAAVRAATGWPVVSVEYWKRVATTESLRRVRLHDRNDHEVRPERAWELRDVPDDPADPTPPFFRNPAGTADLGRMAALDRVGTAFDDTNRRAEMGRVEQGAGRWNLPNIGLHFYRLQACSLGSPFAGDDDNVGTPGQLVQPTHAGSRMYRFCPMGADAPLFQRPAIVQPGLDRRARETDLPLPITRMMLHQTPVRYVPHSFRIIVTTNAGVVEADPSNAKAANLGSRPDVGSNEAWAWPARPDLFLVDPERGRFVLPSNIGTVQSVHVYWHFGRAHEIGGHERSAGDVPAHDTDGSIVLPASTSLSVADLPGFRMNGTSREVVFTGTEPRLVAAEGACPTVDLQGRRVTLVAPDETEVLISGVRFINGRLRLTGTDVSYRFEDCTLVERATLRDDMPSTAPWYVVWAREGLKVTLERVIVDGNTRLDSDVDFRVIDSVLRGRRLHASAIFGPTNGTGQTLTLLRSTVHGRIVTFQVSGQGPGDQGGLDVVEDAEARDHGISDSLIVTDPADADPGLLLTQIQDGCVRYSRLPGMVRAPKQYRCIPEMGQDEREMWPHFTSLSLGHPGFMQLGPATPPAILTGGENGSEMGVGNRQMTATRLRNLKRTTEEFLRFGYAAGPIFET